MRKSMITTFIMVMISVAVMAQPKPSCKGITLKNLPCRSVADSTGYCKAHNPHSFKCNEITRAGNPCKRTVKKLGDKCFTHNTTSNEKK